MRARGRLARPIAWSLCAAAVALLSCAIAGAARAHQGPPYPVAVDRQAGPYTLSVWTDPDVGTGTFFVNFDPDLYRSDSDPRVEVEVAPASGRLAPARFEAHRQRDRAYRAAVPFDREEKWKVRVLVAGTPGAGEVAFDVAVTPPGFGPWDVLIYLTPFAALGVLWAVVAVRRGRLERETA